MIWKAKFKVRIQLLRLPYLKTMTQGELVPNPALPSLSPHRPTKYTICSGLLKPDPSSHSKGLYAGGGTPWPAHSSSISFHPHQKQLGFLLATLQDGVCAQAMLFILGRTNWERGLCRLWEQVQITRTGNSRVSQHWWHSLEMQASLGCMYSWLHGKGHIWRGSRVRPLKRGAKGRGPRCLAIRQSLHVGGRGYGKLESECPIYQCSSYSTPAPNCHKGESRWPYILLFKKEDISLGFLMKLHYFYMLANNNFFRKFSTLQAKFKIFVKQLPVTSMEGKKIKIPFTCCLTTVWFWKWYSPIY